MMGIYLLTGILNFGLWTLDFGPADLTHLTVSALGRFTEERGGTKAEKPTGDRRMVDDERWMMGTVRRVST